MNGTTGVWTKVTLVALVAATLLGTVVMAKAAEATYDCPNGAVTVLPDDTLWGIAEAYCTGDPRAIIFDMRDQNPHIGDVIYPGDELRLPAPQGGDTMMEIIVLGMAFMLFVAMPVAAIAVATIAMAIATVGAPSTLRKAVMAATTIAGALVTVLLVMLIPLGDFPPASITLGTGLVVAFGAGTIPLWFD